jgi:hypothetical protein
MGKEKHWLDLGVKNLWKTFGLAYGFFFFVTSTSGGKPEATVRKTHWIRVQISIQQNNADPYRFGFTKTLIKHSKSDAGATSLL